MTPKPKTGKRIIRKTRATTSVSKSLKTVRKIAGWFGRTMKSMEREDERRDSFLEQIDKMDKSRQWKREKEDKFLKSENHYRTVFERELRKYNLDKYTKKELDKLVVLGLILGINPKVFVDLLKSGQFTPKQIIDQFNKIAEQAQQISQGNPQKMRQIGKIINNPKQGIEAAIKYIKQTMIAMQQQTV